MTVPVGLVEPESAVVDEGGSAGAGWGLPHPIQVVQHVAN